MAPRWTRRHFLQATLGTTLLSSCSSLGLEEEEPLFDGPTIDENEFISFNERYYNIGVHSPTQLPHSAIRNGNPVAQTDPIAIACRLQHLLADRNRWETIETMLGHLLSNQVAGRPPNNFRNMLPRLSFKEDGTGVEAATFEYSFIDNALLSSRVAMAAQAFPGTTIEEKALTYLEKQKAGFTQVLAQNSSGFLPNFGHAGVFGVDTNGFNLLFSGFYAAVAFVLSYYIDDSEQGIATWQAMIDAQNTFADEHDATTRRAVTLQSPLARNGSGFQYFFSLLTLEPDAMPVSMFNAFYNVLYSYLDAAVYDRVPGIYSAGPHPRGFFFDNGLNRLTARQRFQGSQETIVTIDTLAAAMRLFPESSDSRLILRGWIGLYASVMGIASPHGYYGGMTKEGTAVTALYARQNAAMILFKSDTASLLDAFLRARGRPTIRDMVGRVQLTYDGSPIQRVDSVLPVPPRLDRLFTSR